MNERVKELEKQCWGYRVDGVLVDGQLHFDTEKFAKLIIWACAEVAEDYDGAHYVGTTIKQHFGVEE